MISYMKSNNRKIELPKFDPEPSGLLAYNVLKETKIKAVLIGRLAVWAWIENSSKHAFTKDMDLAICSNDQPAVISYLTERGYKIRNLDIGGVHVTDESINAKVDFIHRKSEEWGDLSRLFEEAIEKAFERSQTVTIGEISLTLVPVEYLIAMKIATAERKDETDALYLLEMVDSVNVGALREIVVDHLGPLWKPKLENILREAGHPAARPKGKYVS